MIPLHAPDIGPQEQAAVAACMASGWISSAAPQVGELEERLRDITGSPFVVAVQSGTAALHLALIAAGVKPGDEVLVPDLTFIATANAVAYTGARPVLVDVETSSWQMDIQLAEESLKVAHGRVRAMLLVHVLGYAADAVAWRNLAERYGIALIEDAAGAIGTTLHGQQVGTFADLGILSFNGNKIVTTGGGGAVLCRDHWQAEQIRHLANQAKVAGIAYDHDQVGYNYRMSGIGAALGIAQLGRLSEFLEKHQAMNELYREMLSEAEFPVAIPDSQPNHWLSTACVANREQIHQACEAAGIQTRPFWTPIHRQAPYRDCRFLTAYHHSDKIWQQALSFPSGSGLTGQEIATIREVISGAC